MRLGVLTFHRAFNCGALLQAWALARVLKRWGHEVEFPNVNHVGEVTRKQETGGGWRYLRPYNLLSFPCFDRLRRRYAALRPLLIKEANCVVEDFAARYDRLVIGSDQVWNERLTGEAAPIFFAEGTNVPAIAYAASWGDGVLEEAALARVRRALARFEAVSVRESAACAQLQGAHAREVVETLDPTLLVTAEDYEEIAAGEVPKGDYLLLYTAEPGRFYIETARALARKLKIKCVLAPCFQYTRYRAPRGLTYALTPDRLLAYARNAKYIVAGSFHGTVMGVVFGKRFLSLRAQPDAEVSRPANLLRKLGMSDRLVNSTHSLDEMCRRLTAPLPDYSKALEEARANSLNWLREALAR